MLQLEKSIAKVSLALSKYGVGEPPTVRLGAALDVSYSTKEKGLYSSGAMQLTHDRLMAIAGKFDDNGELDMWSFDDKYQQLVTASVDSYGSYVREHILNDNNVKKWGGTAYAPVMQGAVDFWFGNPTPEAVAAVAPKRAGFFARMLGHKAEPVVVQPVAQAASGSSDVPAWMLFITDGESGDEAAAERVLAASQKHPVYWTLVGVGAGHQFGFIERMADKYPNVGFLNLSSLGLSEDELYEQLITDELCDWLNKLEATA